MSLGLPLDSPIRAPVPLRLLFVFQKQARRGRLQVRDWTRVRGKRVTAACDWGRVNKEGAVCWSCALNLPYVPTGSVGGAGLGTLALALGILGGLGMATLLVGVILWRKRQPREER